MPDYENLHQLMSAYFHQDWDLEADDEDGVLQNFARTTWPEEIDRTRDQATAFAEAHPEGLKQAFEDRFAPMIDTGETDADVRAWLHWLAERLGEHRSLAPDKP